MAVALRWCGILFVVLAIPDFVDHTHSWSSVGPVFHVRWLEHQPSLKVLTVASCLCPGVMLSADVGLSVPGHAHVGRSPL